jgi:Cys-tRNA(Pro)/Cys-tRNA(Cys) deacylase
MAKRSTPATTELSRAGVPFTVHAYTHDPRASSFGLEAAESLGLPPEEVFKTLLAMVGSEAVVGIVPVTGSLDLKALALAAGGRRAEMCDAATAERLTGYVIGGISPVAQRRRLPTFVDVSAEPLTTIYVSGGRRGVDIGLAPADLLMVTGARYAPIARTAGASS